jgi:hypothetical protein
MMNWKRLFQLIVIVMKIVMRIVVIIIVIVMVMGSQRDDLVHGYNKRSKRITRILKLKKITTI